MAASLNDMFVLGGSTAFQNRVQSALAGACVQIGNEGYTILWHQQRAHFVNQVLVPGAFPSWVTQFAIMVAQNGTVIGDATQGGTVPLTAGNVAAQQALVTDTDINNALFSAFNSFVSLP